MKPRTVVERGEKSLLSDPGSEVLLGRVVGERKSAKIIDGMTKEPKNKIRLLIANYPKVSEHDLLPFFLYLCSLFVYLGHTLGWLIISCFSEFEDEAESSSGNAAQESQTI